MPFSLIKGAQFFDYHVFFLLQYFYLNTFEFQGVFKESKGEIAYSHDARSHFTFFHIFGLSWNSCVYQLKKEIIKNKQTNK